MPILILRVPRTRRKDGGGDDTASATRTGSMSRWHRKVAGAVTPAVTLACTPWLAMRVIFMILLKIINRLLRHVTAQTTKAALGPALAGGSLPVRARHSYSRLVHRA